MIMKELYLEVQNQALMMSEKEKSEYFGIYIFSNKLIHFLCSFIFALVNCEEIIVKQKIKVSFEK